MSSVLHAVAAALGSLVIAVQGIFTPGSIAHETPPLPPPQSIPASPSFLPDPPPTPQQAAPTPPPSPRILGATDTDRSLTPAFLSQFSRFLTSFQSYLAAAPARTTAAPSGFSVPYTHGIYVPQTNSTFGVSTFANQSISNPTITGGTISNADSGSFNALQAGTLNLSGPLTGTDATFSGTLTANTLNVQGITSQGALIGPYFTATSTTATSSFAGGFTAGGANGLSVFQNGNIRIGSPLTMVNGAGLTSAASSSYIYIGGGTSACNGCGADGAGIGLLGNTSFLPGSIDAFIAPANKVAAEADPMFSLSIGDTFVPLIRAHTKGARIILDGSNVGAVGIGTTSPYAKLSIAGQAGTTTLALKAATGQTANILDIYNNSGTLSSVLTAGGFLGIGTTSPQTMLHVGTHAVPPALVAGTTGALIATGISTRLNIAGTGDAAIGLIDLSADVDRKMMQFVTDNGVSYFRSIRDNGSIFVNNILAINHAGNVGIGTTTPEQALTIRKDGDFQLRLASGGAGGGFWNIAQTDNAFGAGGGKLVFVPNSALSANAAVTFTNSGNVGIGTTSPQRKLDLSNTGSGAGIYGILGLYQQTQTVNDGVGVDFIGQNSGGLPETYGKAYVKITEVGTPFRGKASFNIDLLDGAASDVVDAPLTRFSLSSNGALTIAGGLTIQATPGAANVAIAIPEGAFYGFTPGNNNEWHIGKNGNVLEILGASFSFKDSSHGYQERLLIADNGNLGIGTPTPTATLHASGTIRFSTFGAGTLETDASGNVTAGASDERLKHIDGDFTRSLTDLMKINPITFHWNETSGFDTATQYAGFSAQNVQTAIPEAVGESANGYLSLRDRPILAAVVNGVKEMWAMMQDRFASQDERIKALEARIAELEARPVLNSDGSITITSSHQLATPLLTPSASSTTSAASTTPTTSGTSTPTTFDVNLAQQATSTSPTGSDAATSTGAGA